MKKLFAIVAGVMLVAGLVGNSVACDNGLCDDPAKAQVSGSITLNHFDVKAVGVGDLSNGAGSFYVVGGEFNGSYAAHAEDWKSGGPWNVHGGINAQADGSTFGEVFTSSDAPDPVSGGGAYTGVGPSTKYSGAGMTVTERSKGYAGANADYDGAKTIWGFPSFGGIRGTYAGINGDAFASTGAGSISTLPGAVAIAGGVNETEATYWGVDIGFGHAALDGGARAYSDTEAHTQVWDDPDYKQATSSGFTFNRGLAGMNSADVSQVSTHGTGAFVAHSQVGGFLGNGYGTGSASTNACFEYGASDPTFVNQNGIAQGNTFTQVYSTPNGVAGSSSSSSNAKTNF